MKNRYLALLCAIVITLILVTGIGIYLKFIVLLPLGLGQEDLAVALPFRMLADEGLRYSVRLAMNTTDPPPAESTAAPTTEETSEATTEATTQATTESTAAPTTEPTAAPTTEPTAEPTTEPTAAPITEPTTEATAAPTTPPSSAPTQPPVTGETWRFIEPQIDFAANGKGDAWFDDVLFVGDSRVVGFRDYARTGGAEYFCNVGMSVFQVMAGIQCADQGFEAQSLETLLSHRRYGKIIISLGINECGYPLSSFRSAYGELLQTVKTLQPGATIILQGILGVTRNYAGDRSYFYPENLSKFNEVIKSMTGNGVYYIDPNTLFSDPDGYLYTSISGDGCHPTGKYYRMWADWISYAIAQLGI